MRRSRSWASRMSSRSTAPAPPENLFMEIEESKWSKILQDEENDIYILNIRDEIVNKCLEICYGNYMDRQAIAFTVHCSYLAWIKIIDIYYMPRDSGDNEDPDIKESWEPDEEPLPSVIDSWATQSMLTTHQKPESKESEASSVPPLSSAFEMAKTEAKAKASISSTLYSLQGELGEGGYEYLEEFPGESLELYLPRKRSIFTRTLSMERELLPLFARYKTLGHCRDEAPRARVKGTADITEPKFIDVRTIRQNRNDIKYTVSEAGRRIRHSVGQLKK